MSIHTRTFLRPTRRGDPLPGRRRPRRRRPSGRRRPIRLARFGLSGLVAVLAVSAPALAQAHGEHGHATSADGVPRYDNLGAHQREISTDVEAAQAYFDQGVRLQYVFNHAELIRWPSTC